MTLPDAHTWSSLDGFAALRVFGNISAGREIREHQWEGPLRGIEFSVSSKALRAKIERMNQTFSAPSFGPRRSTDGLRGFDPRPESPAQLAVAAVVIWLVGALVPVLHILATVGLLVLLVAGIGYLIRPRSRTMYWRGRQLDLGDQPGPGQRIYRTIFKR